MPPSTVKTWPGPLLKAVGHPETTEEVKAALRTDDGDQLEVVEEPLPEPFNPDRQGEHE